MDYKNMSPEEVLRHAEASTDLERRLLELLDDSQDEDWAREAAELEIEELENGIAFRDQQIAKLQDQVKSQSNRSAALHRSLREVMRLILWSEAYSDQRSDIIARASAVMADSNF